MIQGGFRAVRKSSAQFHALHPGQVPLGVRPPTSVAGKKDGRTVFVFDKFPIPSDKVLMVEMHEKGGGRHQTFTVESEDIVRAGVINELKVK